MLPEIYRVKNSDLMNTLKNICDLYTQQYMDRCKIMVKTFDNNLWVQIQSQLKNMGFDYSILDIQFTSSLISMQSISKDRSPDVFTKIYIGEKQAYFKIFGNTYDLDLTRFLPVEDFLSPNVKKAKLQKERVLEIFNSKEVLHTLNYSFICLSDPNFIQKTYTLFTKCTKQNPFIILKTIIDANVVNKGKLFNSF